MSQGPFNHRQGSLKRSSSPKEEHYGSQVFRKSPSSIRETGVIDKLMPSFGFISCCERNESIFFHFSQYNGKASDLQLGDELEFEVGVDSRTGKLIARRLVKLPQGTISFDSISEERLLGRVDCEASLLSPSPSPLDPAPIISGTLQLRPGAKAGSTVWKGTDPGMGRIIYERNGEFFFIPYGFTDVSDERDLHKGDEVSFYMATNKRTGALRARLVRLVQPAKVETVRGLIKTLKDSFGFIERADVVKDIFFHYSELSPSVDNELHVGSSVEFVVQDRQGKNVATQIVLLPEGSVQFDEVGDEILTGAIKNPVIRSFSHGRGKEPEPIQGEIIFESDVHGITTLPYTEKDQVGGYTMLTGDTVQFKVAMDQRDGSKRATCVRVLETKMVEKQKEFSERETGVVKILRDGFGFIRCADRDAKIFFHFNEAIDIEHVFAQQDEVEFTVQNDYTNERLHAIRIKILHPGSVKFKTILPHIFHGRVIDELYSSETGRSEPDIFKFKPDGEHGTIQYINKNEEEDIVNFYGSPEQLQFGDVVQFRVAVRSYDRLNFAVEIKIVEKAGNIRLRGFIATLKESFGFIESEEHDCELFFPFSSCNKHCNPRELALMDEVEYCIVRKAGKTSADEIKKLPSGTIPLEKAQSEIKEGVVCRAMKSSMEYEGAVRPLLSSTSQNPDVPSELPFSITSLVDLKISLREGDLVQFQIGYHTVNGEENKDSCRAVNIVPKRGFIRGHIEIVKDQYGFIGYQLQGQEQVQSVFFHMSSLVSSCEFTDLCPGDEVEFLTTFNHKTQRISAVHVKKLSASVRPDHLLRRSSSKTSNCAMIAIRSPHGPDGTKGFAPRNLEVTQQLQED